MAQGIGYALMSAGRGDASGLLLSGDRERSLPTCRPTRQYCRGHAAIWKLSPSFTTTLPPFSSRAPFTKVPTAGKNSRQIAKV